MSRYSTASLQANRFITKPTQRRDADVYSRALDEDYAPLDFNTFSYTYLNLETESGDDSEDFDIPQTGFYTLTNGEMR